MKKGKTGKTGAEAGHTIKFNIRVRKDQLENCDFTEIKVCPVGTGKSMNIDMNSSNEPQLPTLGEKVAVRAEASGASNKDEQGCHDFWHISCYKDGEMEVSAEFGYEGDFELTNEDIAQLSGVPRDYSLYHYDSSYTSKKQMLESHQDNDCFPESPSSCETPRAGEN